MTTPKVLFVGCDKGAWQMRGRQLAAALNQEALAQPSPSDWDWPDVIVLVKRAAERWWKQARASGKPIVWDVLDCWRQPRDNGREPDDVLPTIRQVARELGRPILIGATKAMANDLGGVYLPHHSRIGLRPRAIRPRAEVVAYDGSARYLGSWRPALERECARLGMTFVINPPDLSDADVLVALRGEEWDGPVCRRWKSGVKYVNAIAAGRPILTQGCAALFEISPSGICIERVDELRDALTAITSDRIRASAYQQGLDRVDAFTVDAVAGQYADIVSKASRRAA